MNLKVKTYFTFFIVLSNSLVYSQDTIKNYYEDSITLREEYEVIHNTKIYNGFYKFYNSNGQLIEHRIYKNDKIWNIVDVFDFNGNIITNKGTLTDGIGTVHNYIDTTLVTICTYKEGVKHGQYIIFWENGVVREMGNYYEGTRCGIWYNYLKNGQFTYGYKTIYEIDCIKVGTNK